MLLYHMNAGYPFLCEDSEIMIPSRKVTPRDDTSAMNAAKWDKMETPKDNEPEYVFLHDMAADRVGNTFAAIVNSKLGIGLKIEYNLKELPYFMQWKSIASGDYAVGLEPANSSVYGKPYHIRENSLHQMEPLATEKKRIVLTFLVGDQLRQVKEDMEDLLNCKCSK